MMNSTSSGHSPRKRPGRRTGSILLETLLTIPLYLVAIGGILWIGDIKLARQKLVMADRYAAWNAGNRHRLDKSGIERELREAFVRHPEIGDQRLAGISYEGGEARAWSAPVGASVQLRIAMPEWAAGWLAGGAVWGDGPPRGQETLTGRVVAQTSRHTVLMRNRFGEFAYRSPRWSPRMLADWTRPWDEYVYGELWPTVDDLQGMAASGLLVPVRTPPGPTGYEHRRHAAYVNWSL